MIKLSLHFKKKETFPREFLALDLGGKLLKAFLFTVADNHARLLGARKAPRGDDPSFALQELIADLRGDFPDLPRTAVVGVAGPLTAAFTTVVRSSLTRNADEVTSHAREMALRQAEQELRWSLGDSKLSLAELEAEVLEVKESEKLELYLFTSFGEQGYLRDLEGITHRAGLSLWGFSSLPFNLIGALSDPRKEGEDALNALIVDIGGRKTEVGLAFGGELMDTKSFWWEFPPPVEKNSDLFLDLWMNAVSDTLGAFEETRIFPSRILLTGGGAALPELVERAGNFPWSRNHPFDSVPEVSVISKGELVGIHAEGTGLDLPEDILPLSLGRVALRVKEGSSESSKEDEGSNNIEE